MAIATQDPTFLEYFDILSSLKTLPNEARVEERAYISQYKIGCWEAGKDGRGQFLRHAKDGNKRAAQNIMVALHLNLGCSPVRAHFAI